MAMPYYTLRTDCMEFVSIILIGIGLSMDAFAVSVCKGLEMHRINYCNGFIIALYFGTFQAIMTLSGFFLGKNFEKYIVEFDHWIAFALLVFLGVKMIAEAYKKNDYVTESFERAINHKELFMLAVATSIDAFAVGIMFALINVKIFNASLIIGIETFLLSLMGVLIGNIFGYKYKSKAEITGGVILAAIGTEILLEHLGIIKFV